ncbi:MAG: RNA polymerase sigma factor, partial [Armatimonadota bacterium]
MSELVSRLTKSRCGALKHLSDLELARRSLSGDSDAYRVLYERSYRRVYGVVARLASRREDVEDVVQDAFVRGYEMLSRYSGKSSFSTWICAVALNLMKSRLSKLAREQPLPIEREESDTTAAGLEEAVAERDVLARALLNLPEHYREVLVLRFFEELSYREIAE